MDNSTPSTDLVPEYQVVGSDIRKSFQRIGALPFIPSEDMDYAWQTLRPTLPADMDSFTRYFESTWMGTPNRAAVFDPLIWNQYDCCLAGLPRSSNLAEWWHNGFRSLVQCTNPTFWSFLTALKFEQGLTGQKITDRIMRRPPQPRAAKWVRYDAQLESFMNAYDNQEYEVLDFLTAVASAL